MNVDISKLNVHKTTPKGGMILCFLSRDTAHLSKSSQCGLRRNRFTHPYHLRTCRIMQQFSANTSCADLIIQWIRFQEK